MVEEARDGRRGRGVGGALRGQDKWEGVSGVRGGTGSLGWKRDLEIHRRGTRRVVIASDAAFTRTRQNNNFQGGAKGIRGLNSAIYGCNAYLVFLCRCFLCVMC